MRTVDTTTSGLLALADCLRPFGVEHVGIEATGVYWKPVWHGLEGHFELVLANAAHVKNVPGRKTYVNDATSLADLLAHGVIRASFVPPVAVQELRSLTRTRKQFVRERAAHAGASNRFEDANLKLSVVLSDILGKGGRAVLQALFEGQSDPERLAPCVNTRVKAGRTELLEATAPMPPKTANRLIRRLQQIGSPQQLDCRRFISGLQAIGDGRSLVTQSASRPIGRTKSLKTVRRAGWHFCFLSYYIQRSAGFLSSDNFQGHHENSIEFKLAGGRTAAVHRKSRGRQEPVRLDAEFLGERISGHRS